MAGFKHFAGGALAGIGAGLVADGAARREQARERLRMQHDREMQDRRFANEREVRREDRTFRSGESEKDRDFRAGEGQKDRDFRSTEARAARDFSSTEADRKHERENDALGNQFYDEQGYLYRQPKGGGAAVPVKDEKGAHIRAPLKKTERGDDAGDSSTLSAAEERVRDAVIDRHTDPNTKRVDWDAVVAHLRRVGHDKIARIVQGGNGAITYEQALDRARAEADDRRSLWDSRETEFPETNGDMQAWITQRAQQIMGADSSQGAALPEKPAGAPMPGAGTQQDPFKATTQAHVDWFRQSAPDGAIIQGPDGKLYRK